MKFRTYTADRWDKLLDHSNSEHPWVYRGQRDDRWGLETSFDRLCAREDVDGHDREWLEEALIREFQRAYHHYSGYMPELGAKLEWLSLMQHHGAPTRLLDFTYSLYVAAYFAVEEADSSCAVWAVNRDWLSGEAVRRFGNAGKNRDACRRFCNELFGEERERDIRHLFFDRPDNVAAVCHVNPFRLNERLRTQRGVFLMPSAIQHTFEQNLMAMEGHDSEVNVVKIVIAEAARRDVLKGLHAANISRASLFPGLDGFARSLWTHLPLFERPKCNDNKAGAGGVHVPMSIGSTGVQVEVRGTQGGHTAASASAGPAANGTGNGPRWETGSR